MRDLFGRGSAPPSGTGAAPDPRVPLPERVRPRSLDDLVGQDAILGPGTPLRRLLAAGRVPSLIMWGPPGSGKTTLARLLADHTRARFVAHSAVLSGVAEIRKVVALAASDRDAGRPAPVLFIDEIHRFNKAQQDAFLPHVERGALVLVGATTENPSFQVNAALLSRVQVLRLQPLTSADVERLLRRALEQDAVLAGSGVRVEPAALRRLAEGARGDARRGLAALEASVLAAERGTVDEDAVRSLLAASPLLYDRDGEEHYNLLSALHKSLRNSDADAAVYWLVRMLSAGEDPLVPARRMVRFASEDVGLADPEALTIALAARDAVHFMGMPEGGLALVEAAVYLAAAPKSNALEKAWNAVAAALEEGRSEPVPDALRNAPTPLMERMGYGRGYRYAHDEAGSTAALECLPPSLAGRSFVALGKAGREREIAAALAEWARRRRAAGPSR